jgi:TonB family protein
MRTLLTVLLVGCASLVDAQQILGQQIRVTTSYYSKDNAFLPEGTRETAYYYRIDSSTESSYGAYSYYISNGQLRHKEAFKRSEQPRYEAWYYENGQMMMEGTCQHNYLISSASLWYPDGKKLADLEFEPTAKKGDRVSDRDLRILQYWDSLGNQLVTNGQGSADFSWPNPVAENGKGQVVNGRRQGTWTGKTGDGSYEEQYDNGKLIGGVTTQDGKTYNYTEKEEAPVPSGGLESFYKFVGKTLKYPSKARRMGQEGKVFVEFAVHQDGVVRDVKVIKGIGEECDDEAARVIALSPKWTPGLQRGVPVKTRMVLPLTFSLGSERRRRCVAYSLFFP